MKKATTRMWAIKRVFKDGRKLILTYSINCGRSEAQQSVVRNWANSKRPKNWKQLYREGYRAIKVTITEE